jgi:hypothetical protein
MAIKKSALHKKLAVELTSLIPNLDEEGLAFLVEQARVHLYNMDVIKHEALLEEAAATRVAAEKKGSRSAKGAKAANNGKGTGGFTIQKSEGSGAYHVSYRGKYKMFTEEEMIDMVRIAKSKDPIAEVTGRLHEWLEKERADTFTDLDIGDRFDPAMKELVKFLKVKFAVRRS